MAITIHIQPQEVQPVYNEIITVLSSDNDDQDNFQYIIDININGTPEARLKIQNNPEGFGVIDLHKHIEPYVTYDLDHDELSSYRNVPNMFTEYDVTLSEEYIPTIPITDITDNGGGTLQVTAGTHGFAAGNVVKISNSDVTVYDGTYSIVSVNTTTFVITGTYTSDATSADVRLTSAVAEIFTSTSVFSGTKYAFNGVENWVDVPNWDFTDYQFSTSGDACFLTSVANTGFIMTQESRMWFNMYNFDTPSNNEFDGITIEKFQNGTSGGSVVIANPALANPFIGIGVGVWNINNSSEISGSNPNFLVGADSYTLIGTSVSGSNYSSKKYTFSIKDECSRYETFQFIYMDRLGSFVPITFNLLSRENVTIDKTSFKKNHGSYNSTTNSWGYNSYDRGKTRLDTRVNRRITVNSSWVTETMSSYIDEMYASPEVYHIDESGNMFGIDILKSNYDVKTRINDQLFNHTFDFEYSFNDAQQK